ncbi:MAG: YggT family protein [Rothia sp. (in: high G+C Gram-positive bacteria)]|nr:YggT family protein [Rothia sp. (in: high G+C Gram-positive bacteria)]
MGYIFAAGAIALYLLIVFFMLRLVLDWVQMFARYWRPRGLVLMLASAVYAVTDPPMNLVRRYIKPLNLGAVSLDLGFMVLILVLFFGHSLLATLAYRFS